MQQGRLIPLASGSGAWNMSVDQALLEAVDRTPVPVLRFYQWSTPTLSLGYFQKLADRNHHLGSRDAQCLRRSTGGGAIMHHHDLTYSLSLPARPSDSGARLGLYRAAHDAFITALADVAVRAFAFRDDPRCSGHEEAFLCFQRRTDEDLVVNGYKVLGSAQRRSRMAILQHGSLLLKASPLAPELPGILDLSSQDLTAQQLVSAVIARCVQELESALQIRFAASPLTSSEETRSKQIATDRFAAAKWHRRR
jgi:lipoate-protein ligase A